MQTFLTSGFQHFSLSVYQSLFISLSRSICVWVYACVCTIEVVLRSTGEALSVLTINNLMLSFSASVPSLHIPLPLSLALCLSQSIQLYVAGMLEVPGEPSLVPAIQTATLHLSTVPGLLKSATGKARDTHRFTLLNRDRQSERQQQVAHTSVVQLLLYCSHKLALYCILCFFMVSSIFRGAYSDSL